MHDDTFHKAFMRGFWGSLYRILFFFRALRATNKICIGSRLTWKRTGDAIYSVITAHYVDHYSCMIFRGKGDSKNQYRRQILIPKDEVRRVRSLSEYKHAFRFTYRFWMNNWHRIYVSRKVDG